MEKKKCKAGLGSVLGKRRLVLREKRKKAELLHQRKESSKRSQQELPRSGGARQVLLTVSTEFSFPGPGIHVAGPWGEKVDRVLKFFLMIL